jgi:hypothetical protein
MCGNNPKQLCVALVRLPCSGAVLGRYEADNAQSLDETYGRLLLSSFVAIIFCNLQLSRRSVCSISQTVPASRQPRNVDRYDDHPRRYSKERNTYQDTRNATVEEDHGRQKHRKVVVEEIGGNELVGFVQASEGTAGAQAAMRLDSIDNAGSASTGAMIDA